MMTASLSRSFGTKLLLLVLALLMTSAGSALALSWNSSSSPLTVTGYGSTGRAYGSWTVSTGTDGTRYRTTSNQRIANADNHTVYVVTANYTNAGACVSGDLLNCTQPYYPYASHSTAHTNSSSWVQRTASTQATAAADYARAYLYVKLDVPWRTDPSSGATITNGVRY